MHLKRLQPAFRSSNAWAERDELVGLQGDAVAGGSVAEARHVCSQRMPRRDDSCCIQQSCDGSASADIHY